MIGKSLVDQWLNYTQISNLGKENKDQNILNITHEEYVD